jgi:hypothetical protein
VGTALALHLPQEESHIMKTIRIDRFLRGAAAAVCSVALISGSTPTPAVATQATGSGECSWAADQLPRTPDAIEGWYADCRSRSTSSLRLGTPDAMEGWLH